MSEEKGIAMFTEYLAQNIVSSEPIQRCQGTKSLISSGPVQEAIISVIIDILQNELKQTILDIAKEELIENWSPPCM